MNAVTLGSELIEALVRNDGYLQRAANDLGITYKQARYRVAREGIDLWAFRPTPSRVRPDRPPRYVPRPLARVLPVAACDMAPPRRPAGTDNGSGCAGVVGEFAAVEVTEILVRFVGVELPVQSNNQWKEQWWARKRRVDRTHAAVKGALAFKDGEPWTPPPLPEGWAWRVTFTRVAHGTLDSDNAVSCWKAHRDAAGDFLGLDDRSPLIGFVYQQEKSSERAMVRRRDRKTKKWGLRLGYRCFFRVRIEQVKVDLDP